MWTVKFDTASTSGSSQQSFVCAHEFDTFEDALTFARSMVKNESICKVSITNHHMLKHMERLKVEAEENKITSNGLVMINTKEF